MENNVNLLLQWPKGLKKNKNNFPTFFWLFLQTHFKWNRKTDNYLLFAIECSYNTFLIILFLIFPFTKTINLKSQFRIFPAFPVNDFFNLFQFSVLKTVSTIWNWIIAIIQISNQKHTHTHTISCYIYFYVEHYIYI